jgi:DNA-binding GntR family transcriptional regulator
MSNVVRATLADQAYRELRSRILSGQLAGGQRLLPEELAVELAISPTPIKEALLRLEADGLVVSPLRKGAVVRRFTLQDVNELYEARLMIEHDALGKAFARGQITPAFIQALNRTLEQHALYADRNTLDDLTTALAFDREFHQQLVLAAGNGLVGEWHLRILGQTHTVFVYNAGDYRSSVSEHRAVVDAIAHGSLKDARKALEDHLKHSWKNTLSHVERSMKNEEIGA